MNQDQLQARFIEQFGGSKHDIRMFFAPGRVNLIGEHTDYNGGYVFPAALTFGTWALARPRIDGRFRISSIQFPTTLEFHQTDIYYKKEDDWGNYPKGVIAQLAQQHSLAGADLLFYGNIPNGAGLSSSASIELVTAVAVTSLSDITIPMIELVQLGQKAENQFVGVNCGIMDQFAVGMGKMDHAMLLKCDTLEYRYIPVQLDEYKLVIANTNKRRGLADSKYNERRSECEAGLREIRAVHPNIQCLGDLSLAEWNQTSHTITNETVRRRVQHVISENERVLQATKSLQENDLLTFGQLMKQSHESLRDDYEVTGYELDTLFEEACAAPGCIGSRMTGAGFGGCTVSLVRAENVIEFQEQVGKSYKQKTGIIPEFYVCDIGDGAKEEEELWPF